MSHRRFHAFGLATALCVALPAAANATENARVVPSYHKDVEPIIQKHCQDCHRPGQVAPFSLLTYDQARKRAADLDHVTSDRRMPPWPADPNYGGPFRDSRVLSKAELETLKAWVEGGCVEGDTADAPAARVFSSEWPLGEPDLVLSMPEDYQLEASGEDEFRVFVLKTNFPEDRWIRAADFKPGNRAVVHHILSGIDSSGKARELDASDPKPGYHAVGGFGSGVDPRNLLPIWTPGARARFTHEDTGYFLPKGADILVQMHYHKSGKPEFDRSSVALYLSPKPLGKEIFTGFVFPNVSMEQVQATRNKLMLRSIIKRPTFDDFLRDIMIIPPGAKNYEVKGSTKPGSSVVSRPNRPFGSEVMITTVMPHMHWLGKDMTFYAVKPDNTKVELIRINRWDFNWQGTYAFEKPVILPAGSWLEVEAHFDNSDTNPANPIKPAKEVRWGEGTNDEMCLGVFEVVFVGKGGEAQFRARRRPATQ